MRLLMLLADSAQISFLFNLDLFLAPKTVSKEVDHAETDMREREIFLCLRRLIFAKLSGSAIEFCCFDVIFCAVHFNIEYLFCLIVVVSLFKMISMLKIIGET